MSTILGLRSVPKKVLGTLLLSPLGFWNQDLIIYFCHTIFFRENSDIALPIVNLENSSHSRICKKLTTIGLPIEINTI